jgi:hypothetical protein
MPDCTCNVFPLNLGNISFASGVTADAPSGIPAAVVARSDESTTWAGNLSRPGIKLAGGAAGGTVQEIQFSRWDAIGQRYGAISGAMTTLTSPTLGNLIFSTRLSLAEPWLNERMRITNYGRVGIGTFNPDPFGSRLQIATYADDFRALTLETSGTQNAISLLRGGAEVAAVRKAAGEPLIFFSNSNASTLAGFDFQGGPLRTSDVLLANNRLVTKTNEATTPGNAAFPALRVMNAGSSPGNTANDIQFGISETTRYAAVSGVLWDGTVNTSGHIAFATRANASDSGLAERMRVTNTGNVGIGTTVPNALLSLGNTNANTKLALRDDGLGAGFGLGAAAGEFRLHLNSTADRFSFYPSPGSTAPLVTVGGTGNVGIGTAAPAGRLHVDFGPTENAVVLSRSGAPLTTITAAAGAPLKFFNFDAAGFEFRGGPLRSSDIMLADARLVTKTNEATTPGNAGFPALRVVNTGTSAGQTANDIQFSISETTRYAAVSGVLWDGNANTAGHIAFATRAVATDAALAERVRITNDGNVGIGTTSPAGRLHVVSQPIAGYAHPDAIRIDFADQHDAISFLRGTTELGHIYKDSTGDNPGPLTILSLAAAGTNGGIKLDSTVQSGSGYGVICGGDTQIEGVLDTNGNIETKGAYYARSGSNTRKIADNSGCYYAP